MNSRSLFRSAPRGARRDRPMRPTCNRLFHRNGRGRESELRKPRWQGFLSATAAAIQRVTPVARLVETLGKYVRPRSSEKRGLRCRSVSWTPDRSRESNINFETAQLSHPDRSYGTCRDPWCHCRRICILRSDRWRNIRRFAR